MELYMKRIINYNKIFLAIILLSTVLSAQIIPERDKYYLVIADTKGIVNSETNPEETNIALGMGSKIRVVSVESDKVYFKIHVLGGDLPDARLNGTSLYYITKSEFTDKYFRFRAGFSGGLLVTPFKFRPDKKKIYPGGNLAYSGSWSINFSEFIIKPVVFAGLTTISVVDVNSQNAETETKIGYTAGFGLGLEVTNAFDLGIVTGWDFIDKDWDSNGKIWLALAFGFGI